MSGHPIDIQIFGRIFRINCPPEKEKALMHAVTDLNNRLQNLKCKSNINNTEQIAFITALNICYELAEEKLKTQDYAQNTEKHIRYLQEIINDALQKHKIITERSNNQFD